MFGPLQISFLNYVRTISASHDGRRWVFGVDGTEQWIEEPNAFRLAVSVAGSPSACWSVTAGSWIWRSSTPCGTGPRSVLVVRSDVPVPRDGSVISLEHVRGRAINRAGMDARADRGSRPVPDPRPRLRSRRPPGQVPASLPSVGCGALTTTSERSQTP
jgi:hypothetical protein